MIEIEKIERDRREDFLFAVALCLIVGAVLLIAAAIIRWVGFDATPFPTRLRIELISEQSANVTTAALVLGAVAALTFLGADRITRARPLVVVTLVVGTAILLLAAYTVVDILTVHIPSADGDGIATVALNGSGFSQRLGAILPAIGTAFIAIVALVGANRLGGVIDHRGFDDLIE
jgi:MFS superfamily sulfate permease-like transporter